MAWSMTQTNMEVLVSFPFFSVVVCAWLTTRKLHGRLASVGLAQARLNYITYLYSTTCYKVMLLHLKLHL